MICRNPNAIRSFRPGHRMSNTRCTVFRIPQTGYFSYLCNAFSETEHLTDMINGHGDDLHRYAGKITSNFSSNVYAGIRHDGLLRHICAHWNDVRHYPEPLPFTAEAELARHYELEPAEVCMTNGATEAIYLVAQAFRERRSAILQPTFSEYADACRLHAHRITSLYSLPDRAFPTDLLWICNPNNPTGSTIPLDRLEALIELCPDILFVIDQSYGAFTRQRLPDVRRMAARHNVILLHSLTKTFAVPGLRIGFLTAGRPLTDRIRAVRMPWSVNQPAIEAAHYLLRHADRYTPDLDLLLAERERVAAALKGTRAIEVWPSDTHILLAELRIGKAASLKTYLAEEHGILIRDASNFHGLSDRHFRLAVQSPPENDRLLRAIDRWLSL